MAITWEINITNVDIEKGRGDVTAIRTDSESALAPRVYNMTKTPIATGPERALVLQMIKDWDEAAVANTTTLDTFLDGLEATAASNLVAWELTR